MTAKCEAWNSELMIVAYQFLFSRRFFTLQEILGRHFHHSCETLMFSLPKNQFIAHWSCHQDSKKSIYESIKATINPFQFQFSQSTAFREMIDHTTGEFASPPKINSRRQAEK